MRYTGPKARLCRREGVNLFGPEKYTRINQRRNSTPGQKPGARPSKLSEFGLQLREKQKAKRIFGLSEKQFRKNYENAARNKGTTGDRLLQLLELRLDNIVYRAGFASTRMQARQFVVHKHFSVNGKRANSPSMILRAGDVITVRDRFTDNVVFADLKNRLKFVSKWLKVDEKKREIRVERLPENEELESVISVSLIVEFYSR